MILTLIEVQRLKNLDRTGWVLRGLPPGTESVAAHSFGVATTAMLLADQLIARGAEIDMARLLRLALVHDWAEVRIGDMPRTATEYFGREARRKAEIAAFADTVQSLGAEAAAYRDLFADYEQRASLEARLVKAADVIDLLVQVLALERAGYAGLEEFWEVARQPDFQLEGAAAEVVNNLIRELVSAREQIRGAGQFVIS
jgi:putative hydrolases of HD superfamily